VPRSGPVQTLIKASVLLLAAAILAFGLATGRAFADDTQTPDAQGGAAVIQDPGAIVDPVATVQGAAPTPTPDPAATPVPLTTPEPPGEKATPTPAPTQRVFVSPGYGSASSQTTALKKDEQRHACKYGSKAPPTSHMLALPSAVPGTGGKGGSWVSLVLAVVGGAVLFLVLAFVLRRKGKPIGGGSGTLEGLATFVAICGGLAALAAQFIPSARVDRPPPERAAMVVRDVKPRITHGEYLKKMGALTKSMTDKHNRLKPVDRDEVGNVVWLQITLDGFKDRDLSLQYASYEVGAHGEALLVATFKPIPLRRPSHDVETYFYPAWVGYPRSKRFMAEFRLVEPRGGGVQQFAATGPMRGTDFRYVCPKPKA
jgi:hypothetical protein